MQDRITFVQNLSEALPYLRKFSGKTMVIKYGGAAMVHEAAREAFVSDMVLLRIVGIKPVVVHGGGPRINAMLKRLGKTTEFVQGLRVTDEETVDVIEMVLAGALNKSIVADINRHGGKAVGLSGKDACLIQASKYCPSDPNSPTTELDIGFVGKVDQIDPSVLVSLDESGFIPVVAPLGVGSDGRTYNINADTVAGEIASALKAEKLILMTDTPGILQSADQPDSLISCVDTAEVEQLIQQGVICGGMIPKVKACLSALAAGVSSCHIIDGRVPHCALLEIFTREGVGTLIAKEKE